MNLNNFAVTSLLPTATGFGGNSNYHDLCVANGAVYLTAIAGGRSVLLRFTLAPVAAQVPIDLGVPTVWRMAHLPGRNALALSDANTCRSILFDTGTASLVSNLRIPLQIMPISMASCVERREIFALNMMSNTVSAIAINQLVSGTPAFTAEPPVTLAAYRHQMLTAYSDLTSVLIQYFKDAWCDLFLVECPTCTEKDKVYLGTIQIKGSRVFQIRNFSKRHYAKSFRTWGYWLSAFPVLGLAKKLFAKIASSTLVP